MNEKEKYEHLHVLNDAIHQIHLRATRKDKEPFVKIKEKEEAFFQEHNIQLFQDVRTKYYSIDPPKIYATFAKKKILQERLKQKEYELKSIADFVANELKYATTDGFEHLNSAGIIQSNGIKIDMLVAEICLLREVLQENKDG